MNFLGHIISADGVQSDPQKTEKVSMWPVPTSKRYVQKFLGLASYYGRFLKDFATIARPLHQLTEKTAKYVWMDKAQAVFEKLRHCLVTAPMLAFPNYKQPFILDTNASDIGIGLELYSLRAKQMVLSVSLPMVVGLCPAQIDDIV